MNKKGEKDKNMRNKGITLIALVITIIVLLILAGVSIATLTGQNGILTRAQDSKTQTEIADEKEAIQLAYAGAVAEKRGTGDVTAEDLNREFGTNGTNATATNGANGEITVTFGAPSNRVYTIDSNGNISEGGGEVTPPTGNLPATDETSPFLPDGATVTEDDLNEGVTIKDSNNNEWVWIVVPKSVTASSTTDEEIKNALITYATDYRGSYSDTWYEGCGLGEQEYPEKYSEMLQSIKANGGFYIGKYEVGSFDEPVTSNDNTRQAVIQQGAYPYNYVTCSQAEDLAEGLATGGKTSTLMFGIQWDLVLKYLEENGDWDTTTNNASYYLKTNSSSWGNYANNSFSVAEGNKYAIYNQSTYQLGEWNPVPSDYEKPNSGTESWVLLSTGAVDDNSKMNIYDLAGNVSEWTLEKSTTTRSPCANRGGYYYNSGSSTPASARTIRSTSYSYDLIGFRPALY